MSSRFNLAAFSSPAFRRYFVASALASASLWMYGPAMDWIVLTQTGRAGAVGIVQTALLIALTISTLPGGTLCERFGAKRVNAVALGGLAATVAGVEVLAATRTLTFETAAGASFLIGIFDGLWGVSAWILLPMSVSPRLLGSAIGLTYLTGGIGRLIGAPLGGAVLDVAGAVAFVPTTVGLLAATAVTLTMTGLSADSAHPRSGQAAVEGAPGVGFRTALHWIRAQPAALAIAILALLAAGSISTYPSLLPALTRDVLHGDAATLGTLSGIGGIGVIVGSLALDSLGRRVRRGRLVVGGYLLSAILIGLLGVTRAVPLAMVIVVSITFVSIAFSGTIQLLIYTLPPVALRARVVSIYTFAGYSVLPVATVGVTQFADALGVGTVLIGMAAIAVGGAAVVLALERRLWALDARDGGLVGTPTQVADLGHSL